MRSPRPPARGLANLPTNPLDQLEQAFPIPGRQAVLAHLVLKGACTPTTQLALRDDAHDRLLPSVA